MRVHFSPVRYTGLQGLTGERIKGTDFERHTVNVRPAACILALDLGTSAFKTAAVSPVGLVAEPVSVGYALDHADGRVTCPGERYFGTAMTALRLAADAARGAGWRVEAVGISSQAQTYLALDRAGTPLADAVVWTDGRAAAEAERASEAIPDVAAHCGFQRFTGQQFLPKVMHLFAEHTLRPDAVGKLLLLNEYVAYRLTGRAFGDETNQGMSGFFDVSRRAWSPAALALAGIRADQLAEVAPAAARSEPLAPEICRALDLSAVPVYLCGNDQTCAAAGVDLNEPGSVLCNFGTAMVIYSRRDDLPSEIRDTQIAGIDPWTGRYFLLGLEGECGNVIEWLAERLHSTGTLRPGGSDRDATHYATLEADQTDCLHGKGGQKQYSRAGRQALFTSDTDSTPIERMLRYCAQAEQQDRPGLSLSACVENVLLADSAPTKMPACREFSVPPVRLFSLRYWKEHFDQFAAANGAEEVARMVLECYRAHFLQLLTEVRGLDAQKGRLIASGGLSRSPAWLDFLAQRTPVPFLLAPSKHPGLLGIARIIAKNGR